MMDKQKLRQADFITGICLFLFSGWVIFQASKMPMSGTYGGVQNTWYTSPAFFPLIIGFFLAVLSIVLIINAIKSKALVTLSESIKNFKLKLDIKTLRVFIVVFYFFTFVYIFIPRVDFFLSIVFFLGVFMSTFYFNKEDIMKKVSIFYLVSTLIYFLIIVTGLYEVLKNLFSYSVDILLLVNIIVLFIFVRRTLKAYPDELKLSLKKHRTIILASVGVALLLCPIFRYALRVPLPYEGGIMRLMNMIYYTLR